MTFNASIPPGVSTLQISTAAGNDLGCVPFTTGERALFFSGIVGALILIVFLVYSNPGNLMNLGISMGLLFFITVLVSVLRGMC
jgi:hypothetical protein